MMFELFLQGIAYDLAMHESFYGITLEARIDPYGWPEGKAKTAAVRYVEARSKGTHESGVGACYDLVSEFSEHHEVAHNAELLQKFFDRHRQKFLIDRLSEKIKKSPELVDEHIREFQSSQLAKNKPIHFGSEIKTSYENLLERAKAGISKRPMKNYPLLTELVGGFNPDRFSLFIARSGFGKTTALVNIALASCETMPVLYVNMEMSKQDFMERAICARSGIRYNDFIQQPERFAREIQELELEMISKDFHFTDGSSLTLGEIRAECITRKTNSALDILIVDYDQKLDLRGTDEEWRQVQKATRFFEDLAKELHIYVFLLAQENESGDVSSSRRAKFVATTVFRFYELEEPDDRGERVYLIEAMKNRYGRNGGAVRMNYDPERLQMQERGYYEKRKQEKAPSKARSGLSEIKRSLPPEAGSRYNPSAY